VANANAKNFTSLRCRSSKCKGRGSIAFVQIVHGVRQNIIEENDFGLFVDEEEHNCFANPQTRVTNSRTLSSLSKELKSQIETYVREHFHESSPVSLRKLQEQIPLESENIFLEHIQQMKKMLSSVTNISTDRALQVA
jgi:hypothetical protein